jgi:hypothetical protein
MHDTKKRRVSDPLLVVGFMAACHISYHAGYAASSSTAKESKEGLATEPTSMATVTQEDEDAYLWNGEEIHH